MKKTFILAAAALMMAGNVKAGSFLDNTAENGISFVAQFGLNATNLRVKDIAATDMNPKAGFNASMHFEYVLPQCYGIYVNAGLEYSMKGGREDIIVLDDQLNESTATAVARPMYLSIPIHVGYRYDVMEDLGVYADFGPYFALGTNGKHILKFDDYREDVKFGMFGNKNNPNSFEMQRADFGLGFRFGAEYAHHYNLIFSFDWGLTNMLTQEQQHVLFTNNPLLPKPAVKNFAAGITFGYRF